MPLLVLCCAVIVLLYCALRCCYAVLYCAVLYITVAVAVLQFMLGDLASACGAVGQSGRRVLVARELTKLHEELFRGTVAQVRLWS
jgi:hypothetical protein